MADTQSSLCMLWMRTDSPIIGQYSQLWTNHRRALISSPPTPVTRSLDPGLALYNPSSAALPDHKYTGDTGSLNSQSEAGCGGGDQREERTGRHGHLISYT